MQLAGYSSQFFNAASPERLNHSLQASSNSCLPVASIVATQILCNLVDAGCLAATWLALCESVCLSKGLVLSETCLHEKKNSLVARPQASLLSLS